MNELSKYISKEFGNVRGVLVNEIPYLVGKDICIILGYSNPSDAIKTHVDEDDKIFSDLKVEHPSLSMATVYRNRKMFEKENKVSVINTSDGSAFYDADTTLHYHFKCSKCGRLYDVPESCLEDGFEQSLQSVGKVEKCSLVFYAVCNNCIK